MRQNEVLDHGDENSIYSEQTAQPVGRYERPLPGDPPEDQDPYDDDHAEKKICDPTPHMTDRLTIDRIHVMGKTETEIIAYHECDHY